MSKNCIKDDMECESMFRVALLHVCLQTTSTVVAKRVEETQAAK